MNHKGSILLYLLSGILVVGIVLFFLFKNDDVKQDDETDDVNQNIQEEVQNGDSEDVIDVIEESKKNAAVSSIYSYISMLETEITISILEGNDFVDGKYSIYQIDSIFDLNIRGNKPTEGNVCVVNGVVQKGNFKINDYIISYDGVSAEVTSSISVEDINC